MEISIIKKAGAAIAQNKDEVKKLLASYNIDAGSGKTSDLIKASFSAIKSGNKDLSADIAGLMQVNGKTGQAKKDALADIKDKIAKAKQTIAGLIAQIKKAKAQGNSGNQVISASQERNSVSNADGSEIETDAMALSNAIDSGDPDTLSKMAMPDQFMIAGALIMSAVVLSLLWIAIYGIPKLSKK
jgi:hypothetical protein